MSRLATFSDAELLLELRSRGVLKVSASFSVIDREWLELHDENHRREYENHAIKELAIKTGRFLLQENAFRVRKSDDKVVLELPVIDQTRYPWHA